MALDISFDQFNQIASGTHNAGQIDYKGSGDNVTLKKVNAHVRYKSLNTATIDAQRVVDIKRAFARAIASHGDGFSHCRAWALWYVGLVVAAPGFQRVGSVVVVHGLRCFAHVGSSWTREGSCLPHWQVNSLPLSHQGSPHLYIFAYMSVALGD